MLYATSTALLTLASLAYAPADHHPPLDDVAWLSMPQRELVAPSDAAHALAYEATAAIVYVATEGSSIDADCGALVADSHSAVPCSSLLVSDSQIPAWPDAREANMLFAELRADYDAFNVAFTNTQPPHWVPHTLVSVGGDSTLVGVGGICGISDPVCDGIYRRGVAHVFANCDEADVFLPSVLAQSWGLETVDAPQDIMNDFGGSSSSSFVDECFPLQDSANVEENDCPSVHAQYCDENQQNSFQELLGMFGPREVDEEPPQILSTTPEDGATIGADETVLITAEIDENSNFLAARWSLVGGGEEIDRCTNGTCDLDLDVPLGVDLARVQWDFLELSGAPLGEYVVTLEVTDAYGNLVTRTITFDVVEPGAGSGSSSGSGSDSDSEGGSTSMDAGSTTGGDGSSSGDTATTGASDDGSGSTAPGEDDEAGGCGCQSPSSGGGGWSVLGLIALLRRRRKTAQV